MTTRKQAWVFAGHGSQYPGMGRGYDFDAAPVAPIFAMAEQLSSLPLRELAQHASADELRAPRVLEPMLAAFSLAYAARLQALGHEPTAVAGYSAGMVPALACAGVLDLHSALALAVKRGQLLTEAAVRCPGAMVGVQGLDVAHVLAVVEALPVHGDIEVAGWNTPTHLTLVGTHAALNDASLALTQAGARCQFVPVAGAWHSKRANGIAARFEGAFNDVAFHAPRIPFYSSVSARCETYPALLRHHLARQIAAPVYWQATLANLCACEGVRDVLEVSCGRTLAALHGPSSSQAATADAVVFSNLHHQLKKVDYA